MDRNDNPFKMTSFEILEALSSFVGDSAGATNNIQNNLNFFFASKNSNSSALNAIQNYGGPSIQSPGWSDRNIDPSSYPSDGASSKPLVDFNFRSVVEEDEFLYGDSNSVTEIETPIRESPAIRTVEKFDTTGWSDDEDPYCKTTYGSSDPKHKKNLSGSDLQGKLQETDKFKKETPIEDRSSLKTISEQKYGFQSDISVLPQTLETKSQCPIPETNTNKAKSKFHVAAELLKKQTAENTKLNSIKREKISTISGISKNVSETQYKFAHKDLKTEKSDSKFQKQTPKGIVSKKHLENIKDYITGPQRKRSYPSEEVGPEKYQRYESPRSFSPPRRHSPYNSSLSSYKNKSSQPSFESDDMKYASLYSKHRSPSFEYEKQHSSRYSESRKQYSPSPKRWSHEKSPDYRFRDRSRRSRDRSPRSHRARSRSRPRRSRSRSPDYHSSKYKTYDKKNTYKSSKTSVSSRKNKKSKYGSPDSFCSIISTESSSSSSSSSSDKSSDGKKKSKKTSVKTASKVNKKLDDEIAVLESSKPDNKFSDDIKKLSDFFSVNEGNKDILKQIAHAFQLSEPQQKMMQYMGEQQQPVSTVPSHAVPNVNMASNLQMPGIPTSEAYAYSAVPATAPVQYVAPDMMNFQHMMPSTAYSSPIMTPAPPTQYGPYLTVPVAPSTDSQYIASGAPKAGNVRQSNLRTIPMTESLPAPGTSNSNITIIPNDNLSLQSSSKPLNQSSSSSLKSARLSPERDARTVSEREDKNAFTKSFAENTSEQNKLLMIEKFKKMKADRNKALIKSTSASKDLDEMRKTMDKTFGKKINASEKVIYTRCKNLFNISLDSASNFNKDARRLGEDLNKYKAKLPSSVQSEVSKIKVEPKEELEADEFYSGLDQGEHQCYECVIQFNTIKSYLDHIQSAEHKELMQHCNNSWKNDFIKKEIEDPQKKSVLKAVKGIEFVKPLTGFYCSLCKEVTLDELGIEQHVKSHQHSLNYMNYLKNNPLYERKCLFRRYIHLSISAKQKRMRETEIKKQKDMERKKNNEAAEKKSKEILLNEKNKEVIVEELGEEDSEDFPVIKPSPPSSNSKIANIKLNLSEKDKSTEKHKLSQELENKNSTKFIYIGKAPNFKKNRSQKPTRWSEKDALNKKESSPSASSSDAEKTAKGIDSPKIKSSSTNKTEAPSNLELKVQKMLKDVEERKQKQVEERKNQEAISKKSMEVNKNIKSFNSSPTTTTFPKSKVNASNSSSNCKSVPLSEIKLPEVSSLPSSKEENTPQPMDIDNSQDAQSKPKSEEEKDFFLLGIKKEDFQPLVVPVPPPTSMVSYPNLYNVQTLPSNVSSGTTSASGIEQTIKTLDFSVPPPTIAPYQNTQQHMSAYGNQNNSQIGQYPYPSHNQQVAQYANPSQINLQPEVQYSNPPPQINLQPNFKSIPPPTHIFRNPPPMLPYSNASGSMAPTSQYTAASNLQYNTSYSNSMPADVNNQAYQPPAFSVSPNPPQTHYSVASTLQTLVPPGSTNDNSFLNYNTNLNAVIPPSSYVQQSKVSPTLKTVGNLIRIVPENTKFTSSEGVIESKAVKYLENSSKAVVDVKNDVQKNQTEKTSNNANNKGKSSKIVKNSNDTSKKSKLKHCINKDINQMIIQKLVIDCVKKVENQLQNFKSNSEINKNTSNLNKIDKDSMHKSETILEPNARNPINDSEISKHEQTNDNYTSDEIKEEIEDVSILNANTVIEKSDSGSDKNIKSRVTSVIDIFDDDESKETGMEVCENQASPQSLKADGSSNLENSSKNIRSSSSKTNEKIIEESMEQNDTNLANNTMVSKQEQLIKDSTNDFSFDETCKDSKDSSTEKNVQNESITNDVIPDTKVESKIDENKSAEKITEKQGSTVEEKNMWDGVWTGLWNEDYVTANSMSEAISKQITEDEPNKLISSKHEEDIGDSSANKNVQNESMKSLPSITTNEVEEKSQQNIDVVPVSVSGAKQPPSLECFPAESSDMKSEDIEMSVVKEDDVSDSSPNKNSNDSENSENMKNANSTDFSSDKEESTLKCKKRIYGGRQRRKGRRGMNWKQVKEKDELTENSAVGSEKDTTDVDNDSLSNSSKVIVEETDDKNAVEMDNSQVVTENKRNLRQRKPVLQANDELTENPAVGSEKDSSDVDNDSLSNSSKVIEEETDDKNAVEMDNSQVVTENKRNLRQRKPVLQATKVSLKQKTKKNQKVAVKEDDNSESTSITEEKADVPACGVEDVNKEENESLNEKLDESTQSENTPTKRHNLRQRKAVVETKITKVATKQKAKKDQKLAVKEDDSESISILEEKADVSAHDQVIQDITNTEDKDITNVEDMSQGCISEDKPEEPKQSGCENSEMETETSIQTGTEDSEKKTKASKSGTAKKGRTGRKRACKTSDNTTGIKNSSDTEEYEDD